MDHQAVDLVRLVAEVCEQSQVLAKARGVTLDLGPLTPVTIQGDPQHLRRLLVNLVDNGLKYTLAVLRVADTGIGLAPEEQERIFQRFYRAPTAVSRDVEGSGLGLCIARSIVEAHGGSIQVESAEGHGSIFTVRLPL